MHTRWQGTSALTAYLTIFLSLSVPTSVRAQLNCDFDEWKPVPIGGAQTNGTGPAAVAFNGNLHLFVTRANDRVYTAIFRPDAGWIENYVSLSQNIRAGGRAPTAVVFGENLYVFLVDPSGRIFVNTLPGNASPRPSNYRGWIEVPGNFVATHEVGAATFNRDGVFPANELDLFARAPDGTIWTNLFDGTNWGDWNRVPGDQLTTHGPNAWHGFGSIELYVRGPNTGIYQNIRDATGAWQGWKRFLNGVSITAAIETDGNGPGLFYRVPGGQIFAFSRFGPTVNGVPVPFEVPGQIAATANAAPAVTIFQHFFRVFVTGPGDRIFCTELR